MQVLSGWLEYKWLKKNSDLSFNECFSSNPVFINGKVNVLKASDPPEWNHWTQNPAGSHPDQLGLGSWCLLSFCVRLRTCLQSDSRCVKPFSSSVFISNSRSFSANSSRSSSPLFSSLTVRQEDSQTKVLKTKTFCRATRRKADSQKHDERRGASL